MFVALIVTASTNIIYITFCGVEIPLVIWEGGEHLTINSHILEMCIMISI